MLMLKRGKKKEGKRGKEREKRGKKERIQNFLVDV
jgi:hypothetical protein